MPVSNTLIKVIKKPNWVSSKLNNFYDSNDQQCERTTYRIPKNTYNLSDKEHVYLKYTDISYYSIIIK